MSGSFILLKGNNAILHQVPRPYKLEYIYWYQSLEDSQFILKSFHLQGKAAIGATLLSSLYFPSRILNMVVTKILKTPLIIRVNLKVNTRLLSLKEKMLHCFWGFVLVWVWFCFHKYW